MDLQPTSKAGSEQGGAVTPSAQVASCWARVGVFGDGSCAQLITFVHCRNCPVFTTSGLHLLDRPLPEDYRAQWTEHLALPKPPPEPTDTSALLFRLGAEWLALPTRSFLEIAEKRRIHSLPHRTKGIVLGLANVRGEMLVCVSLGHLLGLADTPAAKGLRAGHHRLLVVNWHGNSFGFPADEVHGTCRLNSQDLHPPPATIAKSVPCYTLGVFSWQTHSVGFLNAETLFSTLNQCLT